MREKAFNLRITDLGLNSTPKIKKYLAGKKVKIVAGTYSGHNYGMIGDTFVVEETANFGSASLTKGIPGGNTIYYSEIVVVQDETVDDIKKVIKTLKEDKVAIDQEIASYKAKIEFMEANGLEKYNEDEFKVFSTLKTLEDSSTSTMEKAKAIAKLIKG